MTASRDDRAAPRFAGVVPAAGASARMGRPKALLPLEGESFLSRCVRALAEGGCSPVYVVTDGDAGIGRVARASGAEVVVNPDPGEGPITSLRLAIRTVSDDVDGIAYLPVDHPLVTSDVVARLRGAAERSGAALTLPLVGAKRGHPALFRRSLFQALADPRLEGGARTVVHANLVDACLVPFDEAGPVTDVDTPEEYEATVGSVQDAHARPPGATATDAGRVP